MREELRLRGRIVKPPSGAYLGGVRRLCWLLALWGCGSSEARLYGEVHVHQLRDGAHPFALFLAEPVAADSVERDTLIRDASMVARADGGCRLVLSSSSVVVQPTVVDGGAVRIRGPLGELSLVFASGVYRTEPQTSQPPTVFAGGDEVSIEGREFSGRLRTPPRLELTRADELTSIAWTPATGSVIDLALAVSRVDGPWAVVRCRVADEAGQWSLPSSLFAELPLPPRDLQLEIERSAIARVRGRNGDGVILHASWSETRVAQQD